VTVVSLRCDVITGASPNASPATTGFIGLTVTRTLFFGEIRSNQGLPDGPHREAHGPGLTRYLARIRSTVRSPVTPWPMEDSW
jgi:hypothetical protein